MENLKIRQAVSEDIDAVEKIFDAVLTNEENTTVYTNWRRGLYPTRKDAEKAFEAGTLYVGEAEDGTVAASVILNNIQPPEYKKLNWSVQAEGKEVLVIHTLCIRPDYAGRKFGEQFVAFSEKLAKDMGCKTVRLDTYEGNIPAAGLYTKLGYTYTGSTDFNFQNVIPEVLKCFDKVLD